MGEATQFQAIKLRPDTISSRFTTISELPIAGDAAGHGSKEYGECNHKVMVDKAYTPQGLVIAKDHCYAADR